MTAQNKLHGTENANTNSRLSHAQSPLQILQGMNGEDATIAAAVAKAIPAIDVLVTKAIQTLQNGGRVFYIGAGTSGRLGVLDASEMPSTFGYSVANNPFQAIMAGGDKVLRAEGEGFEDDPQAGIDAVAELTSNDILVGISASGSAVYVREACRSVQTRGIFTAGISTAADSPLLKEVDCAILANTGAEYVAGSTRMKSGTAQKMMLNMISTATMIGLGKVYGGYMIDVKANNIKLQQRATKMVATLTGCDAALAEKTVNAIQEKTITPVKAAVVMILEKVSYDDALTLLQKQNGRIDTFMERHGRDKALGCV